MSNRIRLLILPLVLLFTLACGLFPTAQDDPPASTPVVNTPLPLPTEQLVDISGDYDVLGTNPDGSQYKGDANITRAGDGYTIRWVIAGESMQGMGKFDGQTFRVDWEADWGTGEAVYNRNKDGSLSGTWTTNGSTGQGLEELTPK